ncbi:reticulon domain protein [Trypanosoma theileri]|uniref:Reticulon-like protein n=1 Tax=Trypanosoma theileri TaxID=67003 RepID=A0A1X0P1J2_9TRYP|nr:reticulon domain protein [Trypanosoma theileri]XP_028884885.1 reticulon domain protein [Trypanosoma theileri]ORC90816.1 reticulon domain protein [Trypanosoma theileri]ORC90819.1 reticulon domain protein [Trypanosoma theileri]
MSLWDVLAWHRPKVTGAMLGSTLLFIMFFCMMEYTVVTFACRVLQLLLAAGLVANVTKRCTLTSDDIQRAVDSLAPRVADALEKLHELVLWRDTRASAAVAVASVVAAALGNLMSDVTLAVCAVVLAFTLPAVYERKKDTIDAVIARAQEHLEKYIGKIKTSVDEVAKKSE